MIHLTKTTAAIGTAVALAATFGLASGLVAGALNVPPFPTIKRHLAKPIDTSPTYQARREMFAGPEHVGRYDVVMVGDSLTERNLWNETFPTVRVANRGIEGDRAALIRGRLDVVRATQAKKALLLFGVNDVMAGEKADAIFNDYRMVIDDLKPMCITVQSTILTSTPRFNTVITSLNQKLSDYCATGACRFVDVNQAVAPTGKLGRDESLDGIHLRAAAYRKWEQRIEGEMTAQGC